MLRSSGARALLSHVRAPFPGDKRPPDPQDRGRVLDEHGEWSDRAHADEVEVAHGPVLHTRARDLRIAHADRRNRPLEEPALARRALDKAHARLGQCDRKRQSGKPRPSAHVGDPLRLADDFEVECDERVRDVDVDRLIGVLHGRGRGGIVAEELEQPGEAITPRAVKTVAVADLVEALAPAAHSRHPGGRRGRKT